MREKMISYFMGEPEEITVPQELGFYALMSSPFLIVLVFWVLF